jgi:acetolactate synthase-1/2/3 large subunit
MVVTEVGQHQMWTAHYWRFAKPRHFLSSGGLGTMGYGFPASLGVKTAFPDRHVVVIAGDGSIQMNMQELTTAVGAVGLRASKVEEVAPTLERMLASDKVVFAEFIVEETENVFPMIPAGAGVKQMMGGMA